MSPFILLVIGVTIVVGGILVLRMHAFLALILAAMVVAALTPDRSIYWAELDQDLVAKLQPQAADHGADLEAELPEEVGGDWTPSEVASHVGAQKSAASFFVKRVTKAFGDGCGGIGVLIAMAAIVGICLLESGSAQRIVDSLLSVFGEQRAPVAFSASAFTLGIPVFFDTVFYLLMPLGKAMGLRTGKNYLLYILSIVAGATMAHSLVPPTPGPAQVASDLPGVTIGEMMIGGVIVGAFTLVAGLFYAQWANRRWSIPMDRPGVLGDASDSGDGEDERRDVPRRQPPFWVAILPILLPLVLIGGASFADKFEWELPWLQVIGDKNIGLILAALVAMTILAVVRRSELKQLSEIVGRALASAGVIILITAAGKAFGVMLKQSGIAAVMHGSLPESDIWLLPLAFGVTAAVRTAQGSATVAMITSGGIIAALLSGHDLSFHPVYLALAIGCGSKPISWANDSGFWIIGRMTGMTPQETFKTVSMMMLVMAFTGLVVLMVGALILPMQRSEVESAGEHQAASGHGGSAPAKPAVSPFRLPTGGQMGGYR